MILKVYLTNEKSYRGKDFNTKLSLAFNPSLIKSSNSYYKKVAVIKKHFITIKPLNVALIPLFL